MESTPTVELNSALAKRLQTAEQVAMASKTQISKLEELNKRREQQANSDRLIIKFRDKALEAAKSQLPVEYRDAISEVNELRRLLENPPEVAKIMAENAGLCSRIAELENFRSTVDMEYVKGLEDQLIEMIPIKVAEIKSASIETEHDKTASMAMVNQLKAQIDLMTRELCDTKTILESTMSSNTQLLNEQANFKNQVAYLEASLSQANQEYTEQVNQMTETHSMAIKKLQFQLVNAQQDNELLLQKLESFKDQGSLVELGQRLAELQAQNELLRHENDKLIQHHNLKQKLQYHVKIKQENNDLKTELMAAKEEIARLTNSSITTSTNSSSSSTVGPATTTLLRSPPPSLSINKK